MKNNFKSDFDDIKRLTDIIKEGKLNESVDFDEAFEGEFGQEEPAEEEIPAPVEPEQAELTDEVAEIREIALKGMLRLCKTPDDPQYKALKQIFSYTEKAAKEKEGEPEA